MDTERFKKRSRKIRMIIDSATFALLISIALFSYDMVSSTKETDTIVNNLIEIQSSISTRYLGLFPEYIDNINGLLNTTIEDQNKSEIKDSIIIFEDVLYYGFISEAQGFRKMLENLINLTNNGCHITLAYYDINAMPFNQMMRDKLISYENQKNYRDNMGSYRSRINKFRKELGNITSDVSKNKRDKLLCELIDNNFDNYIQQNPNKRKNINQLIQNLNSYSIVDSILTEQFYLQTNISNPKRHISRINDLLSPLPQKEGVTDATSLRVNKLFMQIDSVKVLHVNKAHDEVSFTDYSSMYKEITLLIANLLSQQPNIELIPLKESLMMSCWMSSVNGKEQAIFAFPSKYSTDEIGFISQDPAIARYIRTMLHGIKRSQDIL